jgi:Sec-independent protein translocase protein TatA
MSSELQSDRPYDDRPPRVRLVKGQEVSLGCGTLILIALIVLICSGGSTTELKREVSGLRSEIVELRKAVQDQTEQIKALEAKLDRPKAQE